MKDVMHLIDGREVAGDGQQIDDIDPSTGDVIACMHEATGPQVEQAVAAAARVFQVGDWSRAPVAERQAVLRRIGSALRASADDIVAVQLAETGITEPAVRAQLMAGAAWFDYFADYLSTVAGQVQGQLPGTTTLVEQEPVGVCALFSPWNVP
ncbi:MAG: aldehyde dehydrogenase family protein, partial [Pseudomonadota bacterium]